MRFAIQKTDIVQCDSRILSNIIIIAIEVGTWRYVAGPAVWLVTIVCDSR